MLSDYMGIIVLCAIGLFFIIVMFISQKPDSVEQVEVVGKRTKKARFGGCFYIVSFKFPDGSVKELNVGAYCKNQNESRKFYESINEGDTGKLTYRGSGNMGVIKSESWHGRFLIRFEKDS